MMPSDTDPAAFAKPQLRKRKAEGRSRVTNGKDLFVAQPTERKLRRRFVDLLEGADDPVILLNQLRRRFAALCLAAEQLEKCAAAGEPYDVALLCQISGQISRVQDRIAERVPERGSISPEEIEERDARRARLEAMSDDDLLALKEEITGVPRAAPVQAAAPPAHTLPDHLSADAIATRKRNADAFVKKREQRLKKKDSQKKIEAPLPSDSDQIESLIEVLR